MACLDMNSHPRISFSNDFVDSNLLSHQLKQRSEPPPPPSSSSSDFEFSVSNYSMMSADELFSKGKLLPFKDQGACSRKPTTLREELLAEEDDNGDFSHSRPPKGSGSVRWREILGLKKAHIGSRKHAKPDGPSERRLSVVYDQEAHSSKTSQERVNEGSSGS